MSSASRGEMSKNNGSNLSGLGMKPPHGASICASVDPGFGDPAEKDQRSSGALLMRSLPSSRFRQNASRSGEPGKTPLMPTIAMGSERVLSAPGERPAASRSPDTDECVFAGRWKAISWLDADDLAPSSNTTVRCPSGSENPLYAPF